MVVKDVMNIGDVERVYAAAQTPQDQFLLTVMPDEVDQSRKFTMERYYSGKGCGFPR